MDEHEREQLRAVAKARGTSENFVVRMAIRNLLGLKVVDSNVYHLLHVTEDTTKDNIA